MLSRRKPARTDVPIVPLLQERWSARAFDNRDVDTAVLLRLFEAARWSPSSLNEQPWRFVIARRQQDEFRAFLGALNAMNQVWAARAPILGFALAAVRIQRTGGINRWSWYDTGQAMAHLSLQATHEGLVVHQMAGFDPQAARAACGAPPEMEVVVAFAIGFPGDPANLDEYNQKRELAQRMRRPTIDSLYGGRWGERMQPSAQDGDMPSPHSVVISATPNPMDDQAPSGTQT